MKIKKLIYNVLRTTKYYISLNIMKTRNQLNVFFRLVKEKRHKIKKRPNTIQMPITFLCNFDCVMCGMHHMTGRKDFSTKEIETILLDEFFTNITSVGVNGGEPFLRKDLVECVETLVSKLPKLKKIYFISNGFFTDMILEKLEQIKEKCACANIEVFLSISVDGIDDMQDFHRGKKDAFKNAEKTIELILAKKDKYVDYIDVISTITKYNIYRIFEVETWAKEKGIDVAYNIATENVRIENQDRVDDFSLLGDKHARFLAQEFFYNQYRKTKKEKYYALFLFLKTGKRYAPCPCMYNEWITLTPDCQIGFCATHSKNLGSGLDYSAGELIANNMEYLNEIKNTYCNSCSHYIYRLNAEGLKIKLQDDLKNSFMR